ncbi:MAG: DUF3883 domain-containing protein [Nitrospira sp. CR1.3]|nr:DUF3883 domain-containing protein [Nitrospira sp. CR1.3]
MASDYAAIRDANKAEYGNVARWGRKLLVNRYDSSAHFVFELLQNAEDALKRRIGWTGSREVRFELTSTGLRVVHCGNPFTFDDVKGVCGVDETTKDLTDIGRFGIGFKSVYAITDHPEVHSGDEDFAIENFVFPTAVAPTSRGADQTEFILPLRTGDADLFAFVADSLSRLGARTLLFLRQIEDISWSVNGGASGLYLKKAEDARAGSRGVTLVWERKGEPVVEETWLVFSREARTDAGAQAGFIEIAFLLRTDRETDQWAVQRVDESPLCAFFPTVVTTHLGFLVQGPYRTTPSRDNVPPRDPWNVKLVQETAALLVDALGALKSRNLLDVGALQCLPIERAKYPEGSMFAPLFDAVRDALATHQLLPRAVGGWTAARNARLARTQELRELFDSKQLAALLDTPKEVDWLSSDITRDTASTLRNYLLYELKVTELTPELILPRLNKQFLEAQPDEWILKLYEFLGGQPALVRQGRLSNIPLVRIEGGTQVVAESNGQPRAFLPSDIKTDFPTVPASVCNTSKALEFLKALGLTEPDAVDDVVRNVIPKYLRDTVEVNGEEYEADIKRMINAFATQHRGHRDKLIAALREASFVMSVDAGDGSQYVSKPDDVYLATERLKELFAGVSGVMLVDDSYSCLKGEDVRELLETCGAVRYLRPVPDSTVPSDQRRELRVRAGHAETSGYNDRVNDRDLLGLNALLEALPNATDEERRTKARLMWEELANLEERRGKSIFSGEYSWTHYGSYHTTFDAAFVRRLNETAWIPDQNGELQRPHVILFDSLGWQANPLLLSKIRFKPPILDQLAKEAGIEPGVLDLLKKLGVTREAELRARLGVEQEKAEGLDEVSGLEDALGKLGITGTPTPAVPDPTAEDPRPAAKYDGTLSAGRRLGPGGGKRTPGSSGGRSFVSYVATRPEDEGPDPDGLDQVARLALEAKAIDLILAKELNWQRTPTHNPGFDLFEAEPDGHPVRWCEVKAMTGRLEDRPVGLSRTQFECAGEKGSDYWLYVVEQAGTEKARIVRIQDPARKARTFTFDHGWIDVAEIDRESEERED